MIKKLHYGNSVIKYNIIKSKRQKTSEIRVDEKGIEIHVPFTKKESEIHEIIKNKKQWIYKKQLEFLYNKKKIKTSVKTFEYIEKRVWKLASVIDVVPSKIVIKNMKSRWGSLGKTGKITLNESLINTPSKIIDYVIIHELCHLKINDHSSKYWNLVQQYDVKYVEHKKWLEDNFQSLLKSK